MPRCLVPFVALFVIAARVAASPASFPSSTFPAPFGVNIHFTQQQPGELAKLSAAYRIIRMDFAWGGTEPVIGKYDWSAYDGLVRDLEAAHVEPLFILDYGNNLYQEGPPRTPAARAAYARWAAASVAHFRGHKILWEFWNEPNGTGFWGGKPDPNEYADIVLAAGAAIRKAVPEATLLVGAFAGFPWDYIEQVFRRGALRYADAVSIHPYRGGFPETAATDYGRLRLLIHQYAAGREIPIVSGEWGYSTVLKTGVSELRQAQYLVRQRLINVMQGVKLSIWYDWKEDGPDPNENEHHFGSVHMDMTPKPAYMAALTMTRTLAGYSFVRMLRDGPDIYVMLLRNAKGKSALVVWTTFREIEYAVGPTGATVVDMLGASQRAASDASVRCDASPRYFLLGHSDYCDALASWHWIAPHALIRAGKPMQATLTLRNTGGSVRTYVVGLGVDGGVVSPRTMAPIRLRPGQTIHKAVTVTLLSRQAETVARVTVQSSSTGLKFVSDNGTIPISVTNPLNVSAGIVAGRGVEVAIDAPGGETEGPVLVRLTGVKGGKAVSVPGRSGRRTVLLPYAASDGAFGVRVTDKSGHLLFDLPAVAFHSAAGFENSLTGGLRGFIDGDPKIHSTSALTTAHDSEHGTVADLSVDFLAGWQYYAAAPSDVTIPARATAMGLWVKGDKSSDALRCRFVDAAGQTYQPTYGVVDWTGWRWITMPLNDASVGSWGGPQDGVIHQPIKWDSVLLLDSKQTPHTSHIQFSPVMVMTTPK